MRKLTQLSLGVLAASVLHLSSGNAQPSASTVRIVPTPSAISCNPTDSLVDGYARCALRYEHHRLMRGSTGIELDRAKFLNPISLTHYVSGDSAVVYASRYERYNHRGDVLMLVGVVSLLSGVVAERGHCQNFVCSDEPLSARRKVFMIGGGAFTAAGINYLIRGAKARGRALWWNNSSLSGANK